MRSKCVLNKNTNLDPRTQTQKLFKKKKKLTKARNQRKPKQRMETQTQNQVVGLWLLPHRPAQHHQQRRRLLRLCRGVVVVVVVVSEVRLLRRRLLRRELSVLVDGDDGFGVVQRRLLRRGLRRVVRRRLGRVAEFGSEWRVESEGRVRRVMFFFMFDEDFFMFFWFSINGRR